MPNDVCDGQYTNYRITDSMLCAARSGKDSCQGDSGGPLIIAGSNATEDVQIGVVSWGKKVHVNRLICSLHKMLNLLDVLCLWI